MIRCTPQIDVQKRCFESWNLRWNPFRELTHQELHQVIQVNVQALISKVSQSGTALQLMGDAGRGKSTHLYALSRYFNHTSVIYLHDRTIDRKPHPKIPNNAEIHLIDEAQRLRWLWNGWHIRPPCRLILATHVDLSKKLQNRGFTVSTVLIHQPCKAQIWEIVQRRLHFARRSSDPIPVLSVLYFETLYQTYKDDIRGMIEALYCTYQNLSESIDEDLIQMNTH